MSDEQPSYVSATVEGWRADGDGLTITVDFGLLAGQVQMPTSTARQMAIDVLTAQAEYLYFIPPNEGMREPNPDSVNSHRFVHNEPKAGGS